MSLVEAARQYLSMLLTNLILFPVATNMCEPFHEICLQITISLIVAKNHTECWFNLTINYKCSIANTSNKFNLKTWTFIYTALVPKRSDVLVCSTSIKPLTFLVTDTFSRIQYSRQSEARLENKNIF